MFFAAQLVPSHESQALCSERLRSPALPGQILERGSNGFASLLA